MKIITKWELDVCPKCQSSNWIWINQQTEIGCMVCKKDSKKPKTIQVRKLSNYLGEKE